MQLDVAAQAFGRHARLVHGVGVQTEVQHGLTQGRAVGVHGVEPCLFPETGNRGAAQIGDAEARPFLVGKACDFHGVPGTTALLVQTGHGFNGGNDAERAVVGSRFHHSVEMGAEHDGRKRGVGAFQTAADVSGGVFMHAHARLLHPASHKGVGLLVFRREVESGHAFFRSAYAGKLRQPFSDARHRLCATCVRHSSPMPPVRPCLRECAVPV